MRKLAVARVKVGERPGAVIKGYGFSRTTIGKWLQVEVKGGEEALRSHEAKEWPAV